MKSKPVIAVDIDEVLFPFVFEFAAHHNKLYGTELSQQDFWSYRFEEVIGVPLDEVLSRVYAFHEVDYMEVEPIENARAILKRLAVTYDITILTARNSRYYERTERWLKHYFDVDFSSITMIGYEEDQGDTPKTKAEVCVELGAEVLIDDSLKYLTEASSAGVKGVLFGSYPWNQADALPTNVVRVTSWDDLADHLGV